MEKILTLIIPTYNMERYLGRCLNSLILSCEEMEKLEVLIINDGSKDASSCIAHEYETQYPQTFRVIDKENGNYGSCVNRGLKEMTGKYVKILDADDFFENESLPMFLNRLEQVDADLVLTDMAELYEDGKEIRKGYLFEPEQILNSNYLASNDFIDKINMHSVTYRGKIFTTANYNQTEGISYTDQEWIFYPMVAVNSIVYYPLLIYKYMLDRQGQTMSIENETKNVSHKIIISEKMIDYVVSTTFEDYAKEKYTFQRLSKFTRVIYKLVLLFQKENQYLSTTATIKSFDTKIKEEAPLLYEESDSFLVSKEIPLKFVRYWRKYGRRYPQLILKFHLCIKKIDIILRKWNLRK